MSAADFTLDFDRLRRVGFPEVVLALGKTPAQIAEICRSLARAHDVLVTRLDPAAWEELSREPLPGRALYEERSATLVVAVGRPLPRRKGRAAIVTGGTGDLGVALEARRTLDYLGVDSQVVADVGVAGVLRLLGRLEEIERADVVIAVAGMEASLFSVLGGLVGLPLIAVPTSSGYGAHFFGFASLLAAVNSCANGVVAVNVDSGYAAAMAAFRILGGGPRRWHQSLSGAAASRRSKSTSTRRQPVSTGKRRRSS